MMLKKLLKVLFKYCHKIWRCILSPSHFFLILLTLFILPTVYAKTTNYLENISNSETITQDQQGYIWIAGIHGLTRFDGNKSLHFSKHSREWSIPYTWINSVSSYNDKFLISTENQGAWLFNPLNGQSKKLPINSSNSVIYNILNHKDYYYVYSPAPHRLYKYSIKNLNNQQIIAKDFKITSLLNTENKLYFTTENSLYIIKDDIPQKILDTPISSATTILKTLFISTNNKIWAYRDNRKISSVTLPEKIMIISGDYNKKNLLVITEDGTIYKLDAQNLNYIEHGYDPIKSQYINNIYQDSNSVLWLSNKDGIQRVTESSYKDHPYRYSSNKFSSMNLQIAVLNNALLVGSPGFGLYDFDDIKNLFPKSINDNFSSKALKVMDLLTHNNDLYIATFDGLWRFNFLSQELEKIKLFKDNTVLLSLNIKKNRLYIGTDAQGLLIYDLNTHTILKKLNKESGLSALEVIDTLPLNSNMLWIATSKGIDIYNSLSGEIIPVEDFGASKVYSLTYAENKIFAATQSEGILVYNHQGILLSQFGKHIAFHSVKNIDNELWASSAKGLYKIDPKTHQISLLPNTEKYNFSDSPIKLNDVIYVPHYKGILEIPLNKSQIYNAKVYISKTSISGKTYLQNTSIKLDSSNEIVILELASLDYRLGQEKLYQYKVNSGPWNTVSGNQLTLASLAPGNYKINIKATNSLGEWSNNHAFTEIQVAFPWYWSPEIRVAYIIIILFLSLFTFWSLYLRFKSIKKVHDLLSEEMIMRGKSSLHVSNNLSIAMAILENKNTSSSKFYTESKPEISLILKECLDELSAHSTDEEPDSLCGKNLSIALPFFIEFIQKKYHITLSIKYEIDEELLNYEMQSDLYKIIYEAITAAILKGSNGKIHISIQEFKQKIWLIFNDDADSFVNYSNKINFDMSMYFIRQIAKKHNASVNTFYDKSKGSQLLISFPLMKIS